MRLNSPGGDVFEARAIKAALERHPARVTAYVDGLAASAASDLMLAAERVLITPGAFVMIHNPWSVASGDAREMRAAAELLDQVGRALVTDYAAKTRLPGATIAQMMDAETWLEAEDAVAKGFADTIMSKPAKAAAATRRSFDLSAYAKTPAALKATPEDEGENASLEDARQRHAARLRLYQ